MNRGMITLTKPQIELVKKVLRKAPHTTTELPVRLAAATKEKTAKVAILLSEESAEVVLDSLPIPQAKESKEVTTTRQAFSAFLSSLRFGNND
jgi:hypothetical protein